MLCPNPNACNKKIMKNGVINLVISLLLIVASEAANTLWYAKAAD